MREIPAPFGRALEARAARGSVSGRLGSRKPRRVRPSRCPAGGRGRGVPLGRRRAIVGAGRPALVRAVRVAAAPAPSPGRARPRPKGARAGGTAAAGRACPSAGERETGRAAARGGGRGRGRPGRGANGGPAAPAALPLPAGAWFTAATSSMSRMRPSAGEEMLARCPKLCSPKDLGRASRGRRGAGKQGGGGGDGGRVRRRGRCGPAWRLRVGWRGRRGEARRRNRAPGAGAQPAPAQGSAWRQLRPRRVCGGAGRPRGRALREGLGDSAAESSQTPRRGNQAPGWGPRRRVTALTPAPVARPGLRPGLRPLRWRRAGLRRGES